MKSTDAPSKQAVPFGTNGPREAITPTTPSGSNQASYDQGFPPITMTLKSAGGLPPKGQDMNQILFEQSSFSRFFSAGGGYQYDSSFSSAIGGYPLAARIPNSTGTGFWLNTVEDNQVNPENSTAALTGWVPFGFYGVTSITGLSGAGVTLSTLQAGRDRIVLSGSLTSNINLVVPAWIKKWEVINNCTGQFSVTVKTPSGAGVAVPAGQNAILFGDGVNIVVGASPGSLLNAQVFTSSGVYTKTPGTKKIIVKMVGGGGGGGGTVPTNSSQIASGAGGNSGTYSESGLIDATSITTVNFTVGSAGAGQAGANGANGGASTFGPYLTAPGGAGGGFGAAGSAGTVGPDQVPGAGGYGSSMMFSYPGSGGTGSFNISVVSAGIKSGRGGDSPFGMGGGGINGTTSPRNGTGYGSGGGGNAAGPGANSSFAGGSGAGGLIIVEEYA